MMMMIMILHLIKTSLEKADLSVSSFTDPLMALETFRQMPSSYDLVISDIRMLHLILNLKYPFIVKILFFLIMPKSAGPRKRSRSSSSNSRRETKGKDKELSAITKKQIDSLPEHAQRIYKKHMQAL